jgi:hypothetical protein
VVFVDDDAAGARVTPKPEAVTALTGAPGSAVNYTQAMAEAGMPSGFAVSSIDGVAAFDYDSRADQTNVVHLRHVHTSGSLDVARVIDYQGAGGQTPSDVTQTVRWTTDKDEATGVTVYSSTAGYEAVDSPAMYGYTVDVSRVPGTTGVTSTTVRPVDTTVVVTYTEIGRETVRVVFVDDDPPGGNVTPKAGTVTVLTGLPDETVNYTQADAQAGVPDGYLFKSFQGVPVFDRNPDVDQTITVHLGHVHTTGSLDVTRVIDYQGAGGQTPDDVTQTVPWTTDKDEVTGAILYSSTTGYEAVDSPVMYGYTVDVTRVPATSGVIDSPTRPVDTTVVVTYTQIGQEVVRVVFVDDDPPGGNVAPKAGAVTVLSGLPGEQVNYSQATAEAGVPDGYRFRSMDGVSTFDEDSAVDQVITVHLGHAHTTGSLDVSRVIDYQGAGADTPAAVTQTVTWSTDTDEVTGVTLYSSTSGFAAVDSPTVYGFTVDVNRVPATTAVASTPTRPADSTVTVTYIPIGQEIARVLFVDDDPPGGNVAPKAGATTTLTGLPGEAVGYTQAMARDGVPSGYLFKSIDNVATFDSDSSVDQVITVHLGHAHTAGSVSVRRVIDYQGAGTDTPADVTQTVDWTTDTDQVTGAVLYSCAAGFAAVDSPSVYGFTVDVSRVPATSGISSTPNRPADSTVTVTYVAIGREIARVVFVDDSPPGGNVPAKAGAVTVLSGLPGEQVNYTLAMAQADVPDGYVLVSLEGHDTFDSDSAVDQVITVHLGHVHSAGTVAVNRVVHYQGASDQTPADVTQTVEWTTDTDEVTGVTLYSSTIGFEAVRSPYLYGFTVDVPEVAATTGVIATPTRPLDSTATVTYSPIPRQSVNIVFADDDPPGGEVSPVPGAVTALGGLPGEAVGYTQAMAREGMPSGYQFKSIDNVDMFDDDSAVDQVITVHLGHTHTAGTVAVDRVIRYEGASDQTPADVTQTVEWTTDTDEVTGVTLYSSTIGFAAVDSPSLYGFTVDVTRVPATAGVINTPVRPLDATVTVTYTPVPRQSVNVVFVDDDPPGGSVTPNSGAVTVLSGLPGEQVNYTRALAQSGVPSGYSFKAIDNVDTFDSDPSADQTITVHLGHIHTAGTLAVNRVVRYQGAGDATPVEVTQVVEWITDTDEVTGVVLYSAPAGYERLDSPRLYGFDVDKPLVDSTSGVPSTTTPPVDTTEVVTYTPIAEEVVRVVFVDDDTAGVQVLPAPGAVTMLSGLPGETVEYTEEAAQQGVPEGYLFSLLDGVELFDEDPAVDQVITVHLVHLHTEGALPVSRVIHYRGAGARTPADVTQTIEWATDTDEVNAITLYSSEIGFAAVPSPVLEGFTVDTAVVPATSGTSETAAQPSDTAVTVTYTAIPVTPLPITGLGRGVVMAGFGSILGLGLGIFFVTAARRRSRGQQ